MHNLRRTLEQRWSFRQETVMCYVELDSALNIVDRESLSRLMVGDGMPPKLTRLTKATARAIGADSVGFMVEII